MKKLILPTSHPTLSKLGSNTRGGFQEKWFVGSFTMVLKANLSKFQNQTISSEPDTSIFAILMKILLFLALKTGLKIVLE